MTLGALNPLLRPHLQVLGDHFGGEGDTPFAVQRVDLAGGRAAILVSLLNEGDPIILVTNGDQLEWSSPFPLVGLDEPLIRLALAPGPEGGIALFGFAPSKHVLDERIWTRDGKTKTDHEIGTMGACDALSASFSDTFGWVVACASSTGTRAQRIAPDGSTLWGSEGSAVGEQNAAGPPTIVFDSPATWCLVQRAKKADADHLLASRFDDKAQLLWENPVDIGVPRGRDRAERIDAAASQGGGVSVELPGGLAGSRAKTAEIAADGVVRLVAP